MDGRGLTGHRQLLQFREHQLIRDLSRVIPEEFSLTLAILEKPQAIHLAQFVKVLEYPLDID